MSLPVLINIVGKNPYSQTVPDEDLEEIIVDAVMDRAREVEQWYERRGALHELHAVQRNSFAFAILDPTAPIWRPTDQTVLAIAAIGPEGEQFVPNALAKAFVHRDHGVDCGVLMYAQKHRLADGDFRKGFSVNLEGTIVGGSGLTEIKDRYQCTLLAAAFNYGIHFDREVWEGNTGPDLWYTNNDGPGERYAAGLGFGMGGAITEHMT